MSVSSGTPNGIVGEWENYQRTLPPVDDVERRILERTYRAGALAVVMLLHRNDSPELRARLMSECLEFLHGVIRGTM